MKRDISTRIHIAKATVMIIWFRAPIQYDRTDSLNLDKREEPCRGRASLTAELLKGSMYSSGQVNDKSDENQFRKRSKSMPQLERRTMTDGIARPRMLSPLREQVNQR